VACERLCPTKMILVRAIAPAVSLVLALLLAAGCNGCRRDHPYVPYAISSAQRGPFSEDEASVAARSDTLVDAGQEFAAQPSLQAPAATGRWSLEGIALEAPDGLVFQSALVSDFDGDGEKEAFAIAHPAEGNDPGEVLFYRGREAGDALAIAGRIAAPPLLARDASCLATSRLAGVGKRSVLVELGSTCPLHAVSGPVRWIAVLDAGTSPRVRFAATLADPPGAPALLVEASVGDRDGDGRDDLAIRVTLEGGGAPFEPGPRVSAIVAWLDRPSGLSRDTGASEAAFELLAKSATARAPRAKDAPAVPGFVAQARALWRAVCAEGGSPRVVAVAGTGAIGCGGARALEDLGLAEVRAYVTMGDPLRAALALDRGERAPAARSSAHVSEAQKWIAQLAPIATARLLRAAAAVPLAPRGHEPAWGPLAFEPSGKLLVRTRAGVVRLDPDQGDEAAANVPDWPVAVSSPDGVRKWIDAYDPCDGLPVHALFEMTNGENGRDVLLPVMPALGGRCVGSRSSPVRAIPIAWGPGGLEAIVEGQPVLVSPDLGSASLLASFLDQPQAPGAPRSPDGKAYVISTEAGLLVRREGRSRLLRGSELDATYGDQHDCTVSNDTTHVACVHAGQAWVGTWDPF
jgi:hypothetical protein